MSQLLLLPQLAETQSDMQFTWEANPLFGEVEPHVFQQFKTYHSENPHVFEQFRKIAYDMRQRGFTVYSAKAIVEAIRWHYRMQTTSVDFKISNSVTSCYPRLLMILEPSFQTFFKRHQSNGLGGVA